MHISRRLCGFKCLASFMRWWREAVQGIDLLWWLLGRHSPAIIAAVECWPFFPNVLGCAAHKFPSKRPAHWSSAFYCKASGSAWQISRHLRCCEMLVIHQERVGLRCQSKCTPVLHCGLRCCCLWACCPGGIALHTLHRSRSAGRLGHVHVRIHRLWCSGAELWPRILA